MAADCALHQALMYQCQPLTYPLEFTNVSHGNKLQQFRASSVRNPSFSRFNFSEKSSFFFLPAYIRLFKNKQRSIHRHFAVQR